ncbi:hypothetical protein GCM10020256_37520 [Streptomyces thermocoprophilus]
MPPATTSGLVSGALGLHLSNPARVPVDDATVSYGGTPKTAALDALPSVRYANRYAVQDSVSGMRVAGAYYLAVHLSERVAERFGAGPFEVTLRVRVAGAERQPGPEYAGPSVPADAFRVTDEDRTAAAIGSSGLAAPAGGSVGGSEGGSEGGEAAGRSGGSGGGTAMKALAAGGHRRRDTAAGGCSAPGRCSPGAGPLPALRRGSGPRIRRRNRPAPAAAAAPPPSPGGPVRRRRAACAARDGCGDCAA